MRSLILTILILSNIVGGIEVASDINDVWADIGVLTAADTSHSETANGGNDPIEASDCDHCCHGGAHFAGFACAVIDVSYSRASFGISFRDNPYQLASGAPPTPPPNA